MRIVGVLVTARREQEERGNSSIGGNDAVRRWPLEAVAPRPAAREQQPARAVPLPYPRNRHQRGPPCRTHQRPSRAHGGLDADRRHAARPNPRSQVASETSGLAARRPSGRRQRRRLEGLVPDRSATSCGESKRQTEPSPGERVRAEPPAGAPRAASGRGNLASAGRPSSRPTASTSTDAQRAHAKRRAGSGIHERPLDEVAYFGVHGPTKTSATRRLASRSAMSIGYDSSTYVAAASLGARESPAAQGRVEAAFSSSICRRESALALRGQSRRSR